MITVYGADWCEDTRRSLRQLRRLGIPHRYLNVDEDLDALERAKALNGGQRRTPTIDLGLGGSALVEPDNDTLTAALAEIEMLGEADARERTTVQNVGDIERMLRAGAGFALLAASGGAPAVCRWPLRIAASALTLSAFTGWCPAYHYAGVTSLDGPGDWPDEARRLAWVAPRRRAGRAEGER
jgi:glutaredoxin